MIPRSKSRTVKAMNQNADALLEQFGLSPYASDRISVGQTFGRLTVHALGKLRARRFYAICQCACGSPLRMMRIDGLLCGRHTGCGCVQREASTKHGLWGHPLYDTWRNMYKRCYDPRNKRFDAYGGRGIVVCDRWHNVQAFVEDLEPSWAPGLELDRIDNDKSYSPENCRWVTHTEQARNKRSLRRITVGGRTMTAAEWARENGLNYGTVLSRLSSGWDPVEAVTNRSDARRSRRA